VAGRSRRRVVGWFDGRMSSAEGARSAASSATAQPEDAGADEHQDQVPRGVPAVRAELLKERVGDYFEMDVDSPYMLLVPRLRESGGSR